MVDVCLILAIVILVLVRSTDNELKSLKILFEVEFKLSILNWWAAEMENTLFIVEFKKSILNWWAAEMEYIPFIVEFKSSMFNWWAAEIENILFIVEFKSSKILNLMMLKS